MIVKRYRSVPMEDLVGIAEIAAMIGVTTQRVDQLARSDDGFPKPVAELAAGRIWVKADVEAWARSTGRADSPADPALRGDSNV